MYLTRPHSIALVVLVGLAGGCRDGASNADGAAERTAPADSIALDQPAPARAPLGPPPDSSAPSAAPSGKGLGLWDVVSLEKRLDLQGMAPRKQLAPARHSFLSVEGSTYLIGNAELQVFLYGEAAAANRDVAQLDTIEVARLGEKGRWPTKATLIRNNNLVAILLGQNALQIERVQRALMAGLPPSS